MTHSHLHLPIPTSFGTLGMLQRQCRQLLSAPVISPDVNERPVAFALFNKAVGILPEVMDCRHLVLFDKDEKNDPILVLAAVKDKTAVYLAVNLTDRSALRALESAVSDQAIELVLSGPGCATSHSLVMSSAEATSLEDLTAEYLDLALVHDRNWLFDFSAVVPNLPNLLSHMHPALARCERHTAIVLRGDYDAHLSALRTAVRRGVSC